MRRHFGLYNWFKCTFLSHFRNTVMTLQQYRSKIINSYHTVFLLPVITTPSMASEQFRCHFLKYLCVTMNTIYLFLPLVLAFSVLLFPAAVTCIRNISDCSTSVVVLKFFGILSIAMMLSVVMAFTSHIRHV